MVNKKGGEMGISFMGVQKGQGSKGSAHTRDRTGDLRISRALRSTSAALCH